MKEFIIYPYWNVNWREVQEKDIIAGEEATTIYDILKKVAANTGLDYDVLVQIYNLGLLNAQFHGFRDLTFKHKKMSPGPSGVDYEKYSMSYVSYDLSAERNKKLYNDLIDIELEKLKPQSQGISK